MIRGAILACDRKPAWVRLICSTEPTTKKWRTEKLKHGYSQKYRKAVRVIRGVSPEEGKEGYSGNDLQKRKALSLEWKSEGVMDDESGELMEPMEEVPLIELGEAELERLVRDWRREAGGWFQRRREAYWKQRSVIRRVDEESQNNDGNSEN